MSFTVKCDKCGNEAKLTNGNSMEGNKIQIFPSVKGEGYEREAVGVEMYCENPKCRNELELV